MTRSDCSDELPEKREVVGGLSQRAVSVDTKLTRVLPPFWMDKVVSGPDGIHLGKEVGSKTKVKESRMRPERVSQSRHATQCESVVFKPQAS